METLKNTIAIIRPKQWSKNFFVFIALIFSEKLFEAPAFITTCIAFTAFCLAASGIYTINDLFDRELDARHKTKKNRPLASGKMKSKEAVLLIILLIIASYGISLFFLNNQFAYIITFYILNNIFYSLWLKNIIFLDVLSIALGFILRAVGGAVAIDVTISPWLIVTVFLLTLFIAISKRILEKKIYQKTGNAPRKVLEHYNEQKLKRIYAGTVIITLITYTLYTLTSGKNSMFVYTLPFALFGLYRYYVITQKEEEEDNPTNIIIADQPLNLTLLIWIMLIIFLLYFA